MSRAAGRRDLLSFSGSRSRMQVRRGTEARPQRSGSAAPAAADAMKPSPENPAAESWSIDDLVYDWNRADTYAPRPARRIEFDDETLRDGLQSPSVTNPTIERKIELLHLMDAIGIDTANVGLPGAGPFHMKHIEALAREVSRSKLRIGINVACRTVVSDIEPVVELTQRVGIPIEVCAFIGSSRIRSFTEDWSIDRMLKATEDALSFAAKHQLPVMYVTEDTTRAHPATLERLFGMAIDLGAKRLCFCDTCGHATPDGVRALIRFGKDLVKRKARGRDVKIDWHGHQDRGLGVANVIAAIEAGADRVHGAALGVGERAGNAPMDLMLVNLKLLGWIDNDLTRLGEYCTAASQALDVPIPHNYPVFGSDAFETATGVHAAAVVKALRKGDVRLANLVYSGVPADEFGLEQVIRIGPMSGRSNVAYWLEKRGHEVDDALVEALLDAGKNSPRLLTDDEAEAIVRARIGN
jgi:isopropylmalate/homocitrate/citramalate synthase